MRRQAGAMRDHARYPYRVRYVSDEHAEETPDMANMVNLDALILREDFEVDDKNTQVTKIEKLPIRDLEASSFFTMRYENLIFSARPQIGLYKDSRSH
jgi:hypothetical protein